MAIRLRHITKGFGIKPHVVPVSSLSKAETAPASKKEGKEAKEAPKPHNKTKKEDTEMLTEKQLEQLEQAASQIAPEVKVAKRDRGLIERTESSKIVLTEDNRQVLND